ncbi:MAG: beta-ribofuranosylaminobenzene 5'-phosphate synthase [Methanobacteriaceae archaeon]
MIIKTPSRLHMTLIDLNGSYGRADGGIGLTIEEPNFILRCEPSEKGITVDFTDSNDKYLCSRFSDEVYSECSSKIKDAANKVMSNFNIDSGFHFTIEKAYPMHSGLGSGTQVALASSKLICEFEGIEANSHELGAILKRGGTSGVGLFSFDYGGFIVDGGHSLKEKETFLPSSASPAGPPQLIGRYEFPEEWNVVVAIPNADNSVTGDNEIDLFQEHCPVPVRDVEKLSHLILMNLIPFLLEKDIESFGSVINEIQKLGFKKVEHNLQSNKISDLMDTMLNAGACGSGMSSFGPAVYGITDGNGKDILKAVNEVIGNEGLSFVTKAKNNGYDIIK